MASAAPANRASGGSGGSSSSTVLRMMPLVFFLIIIFFTLLCLFSFTREQTNIQTPTKLACDATATFSCPPSPAPAAPPVFRLFIGILTQADQYWRRNMLRLAYGTQTFPSDVRVDVKFVFCNLEKEDQRVLVSLEIIQFDDIVILNCTENMDSGKTYVYFSSMPKLQFGDADEGRPYDYVMKADDDTYVRVHQLVESLRPLARDDLYYGFTIPCREMDPFHHYMSGMGYLLSWDLVEWISTSDVPTNHTEGPEDQLVGDWLEMGGRGRNRFNAKPAMIDYPSNGRDFKADHCEGPITPDIISVHRLKNQARWVDTFQRFNVTEELKPSRLYYIDWLISDGGSV